MPEFIGHFHPLLVHLPIGILLIALLLYGLSKNEKYHSLKSAVPVLLLCGAVTALLSCITGYMLSTVDDYDETLLNRHMWLAIASTVLAFVFYFQHVGTRIKISHTYTAILLLVLITITGHFGGSLTHGSDYLSAPLTSIIHGEDPAYKILPLKNAQEAKAYTDVVKPILQAKCYSCHNQNKQKGSLRMDDSLLLMKGGKHGMVIDLKDLSSSELLKRIELPSDNDHHMPPKEKPQLTENQLALLHWWINGGASLTKKAKEIPQDDKVKKALASLQHTDDVNKEKIYVNLPQVSKGNENAITALKTSGVVVYQSVQNNNFLDISFVNKSNVSRDDISSLNKLSEQVLSLNLHNSSVDDNMLESLTGLKNLAKIDLSNTKVTDAGIQVLAALPHLSSFSVVSTAITEKGILAFKNSSSLKNIYAYNTAINKQSFAQLKNQFPKTKIDTGGYYVAVLPTDTTMLKTDY